MTNYFSYFPADYTPNNQQAFILTELAKAKAKNLKYAIVNAPTGTGKCFRQGTRILMFDGTTEAVENITIGDKIMGDDETPRTILSLTTGKDFLYTIKSKKLTELAVTGEHILCLKHFNPKEYITINGKQYSNNDIIEVTVNEYLKIPKSIRKQLKIYKKNGLDFTEKELEQDPYFLGLGVINNSITVSNAYKTSSKAQRLKLLAGILDSGGNLSSTCFSLKLENKQLLEDIAFIANSLGFNANIKHLPRTRQYKLSISGDMSLIPCKTPRNQFDSVKQSNDDLHYDFEVVKNKEMEIYYGFETDGNHRFLLDNLLVTHNSHIAKTIANSIADPCSAWKEFVKSGAIYDIEEDDISSINREGTAVLTMSKALQDQYFNIFDDGALLKGKSNYPCSMMPFLSCDIGPCAFEASQKDLCIKCGQCEYYSKRDEAVSGQCSFYSYSMFLSLPPACRAKKNLICDEASELEDILVQSYTIPFNFKMLDKLDLFIPVTPTKGSTYEKYVLWLRSVKGEVFSKLNDLRKKYKTKELKKLKREEKLKFKAITVLNDSCDKILKAMEVNEFIIEHSKEELTFKPYKVDKLAQSMFKYCDFVVLMSATIIDPPNFAKQLGIKESEYLYIEAPSTFDPKKAPIKLSNNINVTYANKAVTIPKLAEVAKHICDAHSSQKGIIHTHSMDITNELKKALGNQSRFLYREKGITNENIIERHTESPEPTVLVSPSMTHGIDLKGDLGEFAIVMKAPFLPLGDLRIKKMCEEDPQWYLNKMLSNFIQMCGRTVRSADDTSITYVLDGTLTKKLLEMRHKIPKYFIERFC